MKRGLGFILFVLATVFFCNKAIGQAEGDYRTIASGDWNSGIWERFTSGQWVAAGPPSVSAETITIRVTHIVTVSTPVTADQVVVIGQINTTSTLTILDGAGTDLYIQNNLTGGGTVLVYGSMLWTAAARISCSLVIESEGSLTVNSVIVGVKFIENGGSVTIETGASMFWITGEIRFSNGSTLTNNGTIETSYDGNGLVQNAGSGNLFTNNGTFAKISGSGSFNISVATINTGTFSVLSGTVNHTSNYNLTNSGTINVAAGCTFIKTSSSLILNAGTTLTGSGSLLLNGDSNIDTPVNVPSGLALTQMGSGNSMDGAGALTVDGTMIWQAGAIHTTVIIHAGGTMTLNTTSTKALYGVLTINTGAIMNWDAGTINFYNGSTLNNAGTLHDSFDALMNFVSGATAFNNSGSFLKTGGTGTTTIEPATTNTGTIGGNNTISFTGTLSNSGIISPGLSTGIITLNSTSPLLSATSTLFIEINNNSGAGTGHDQLKRAGNLVLNGTLNVVETGAVSNGSFTIISLTTGTISGNFSIINLPPAYSVSTTTTTVVLTKAVVQTYYQDSDGDSYGNPAVSTTSSSPPPGYVLNNTDCNDNNVNIHPGATETCNGLDDDCDGQIDEGLLNTFFQDADGDGYGNASVSQQACSAPAGYVSNNTDCNDNNSTIHPGAAEQCNGLDDDCDGLIDESISFVYYQDMDGDGYGNTSTAILTCNPPAGYITVGGDCNDNNANIHPNATETCNGLDDDCDGQIDEGLLITFYQDADGDGYGNASVSQQACSQPAGYVANSTDCNDGNASVHPNATEVCNGIDDDCDGQVDEGLLITFYQDADGDGYGNASVSQQACSQPAGYVANSTDCNDGNASVHPNATEVCNGIDDDCDGQVDEGLLITFYQDGDGDGYGNASVSQQACSQPAGYVANSTDCNDGNASVHPNATEVCNGLDDDCDGQIDNGLSLITFYQDADGDGYGNASVSQQACFQPAGYVANNADCNDGNASVHPNATEVCNGLDDNCDGLIDEGVKQTFYRDADGDGYGNLAISTQSCSQPAGYVANSTDCNDSNANVNPGHAEVCCNFIDDDCDGQIDEGACGTCQAGQPRISIVDVSVLESSGTAQVQVNLSWAYNSIVTVKYKTVNGTAKQPRDYTSTSGTLTFSPNEVTKYISVPIIADNIPEPDEYFNVQLSRSTNASIFDANGVVTITETVPPARITDNHQKELQNINETKTIVPNPQHKQQFLKIFGLEPGKFDVLLMNVTGEIVADLKGYQNNWSMAKLTPGLYFYRVLYRNNERVLKIVSGELIITD